MIIPKFDHYTIKVTDLQRSCDFYRDVLGLEEIKNRTEKSYIRWFSLGTGELHIVEGKTDEIQTNIGIHLALWVDDFSAFLSILEKHNIVPHTSKGEPNQHTVRADGVKQVYFIDPDGYWIEVNDAAQ